MNLEDGEGEEGEDVGEEGEEEGRVEGWREKPQKQRPRAH